MSGNKIETFEDLRVWQKGISLVKQVYLVTKQGEISRDFGFRDSVTTSSSFKVREKVKGQREKE